MRLPWLPYSVLCVACTTFPASAQDAPASPSCRLVHVVRDTLDPVRKGIDASYGKIADAIRRKDIQALFALHSSGFHAELPSGETWTRERSLSYQRDGTLAVRQTHHISNTVVRLRACGDTATATVLQVWRRTQPMGGKLRRVDTHAVQDERWVRTPTGWLRDMVSDVAPGLAFVDGKRVTIMVPYDPEAPEYDPYDPRPKRPAADTLLQIATEHGIAAAVSSARALRASPDHYVTELQLNQVGYRLLELKRARDAIQILELNAALYPSSANVYDSLGEAYLAAGDRARAITNYRRALRMDPTNTNAAEQLRKLGAG